MTVSTRVPLEWIPLKNCLSDSQKISTSASDMPLIPVIFSTPFQSLRRSCLLWLSVPLLVHSGLFVVLGQNVKLRKCYYYRLL